MIEHSDALCGQRESDAYKRGWDDCAKFAAEQAKARLSKNARSTSRQAVARNSDIIKGVQADVYAAISRQPLTDFDLEDLLGRTHQSVSAARNALMMAGLITDSGERRKNRRGNNCIVWMLSSPSSKEEDDRTAPVVPVAHVHTCNGVRPTSVDTCPACLAERGQGGLWP